MNAIKLLGLFNAADRAVALFKAGTIDDRTWERDARPLMHRLEEAVDNLRDVVKAIRLTQHQRALLESIAEQCPSDECTGACNMGWYEPIERTSRVTANRLSDAGLIDLTNGRQPRWIASHVTAMGRLFLATHPKEGVGKAVRRRGINGCA